MLKEKEMSLADFHKQLQRHKQDIKHAWDSTSIIYKSFIQEDTIHREHCSRMRDEIYQLRIPTRSFYRLLATPSHLPFTIVSHSFSLARTLCLIDELTDELMVLMLLFRKASHSSSQNMSVRPEEILYKLYALDKGFEDILQQSDRLLLKVLAQEKDERKKLKSLMYSF